MGEVIDFKKFAAAKGGGKAADPERDARAKADWDRTLAHIIKPAIDAAKAYDLKTDPKQDRKGAKAKQILANLKRAELVRQSFSNSHDSVLKPLADQFKNQIQSLSEKMLPAAKEELPWQTHGMQKLDERIAAAKAATKILKESAADSRSALKTFAKFEKSQKK